MTTQAQPINDPWLARPRPAASPRVRLFCFPYAGGGASIYHAWAAALPADVELCAVKLPGRETRFRDPLFQDIGPLLDALVPVITAHANRPFAFFGHSMGALIGFELARRLAQAGAPQPQHLFVSGRRAPHRPNPEPPIAHLPDPEFLAELKRRYGTPNEAFNHPELVQLMLPTLRADCGLCERYAFTAQPQLALPITAFGGHGDNMVSADDVEAWRDRTTGPFAYHMLDGDHFFLHNTRDRIFATLVPALTATA